MLGALSRILLKNIVVMHPDASVGMWRACDLVIQAFGMIFKSPCLASASSWRSFT